MRRIVLSTLAILISAIALQAQNQPSVEYFKSLIKKNAAAIGIANNDLANWRVLSAHFDKHVNVTYVRLQQTCEGIDINNRTTALSFKNDKFISGQLNKLEYKQSGNRNAAASVDAKSALLNAAGNLKLNIKAAVVPVKINPEDHSYEFDNLGISFNKIPVKLTWMLNDANELQLMWQVMIAVDKDNAMWDIYIDAHTGQVYSKNNLTVYERDEPPVEKYRNMYVYEDEPANNNISNSIQGMKSITSSKYNVIAYPNESPLIANPSVEVNPWTRNHDQDANTLKWNSDGTTDFKILRGNNVYVQQDLDSNNGTGFSASSSTNPPDLTFNFAFDPNALPTEDPSFAETNLFYWNNLMHDMSYQYGFDEAAGNFQANNLGRGGKENDFIYSDAEDGAGNGTHLDNANFLPTDDGQSPRLQMYLWSSPIKQGFYVNSPTSFKGPKPSREGNVSNNNELATKGPITQNIVIFKDSLHPDSSTACGSAANAAELAGKIAYADRGTCNFTVKYLNAQAAGAKAIIVGNVAPNDPRYMGNSPGNALFVMSGSNNDIIIPGIFIQYDTAKKIKALGSGNVNATMKFTPKLDGAIDNTIHTHEYGHGITHRLIGTSCLRTLKANGIVFAKPYNAEVMDEGWSDFYALMMTQNWKTASVIDGGKPRPIGNYAGQGITIDSGVGSRTYPYSTSLTIDKWTYDSLRTDASIPELQNDNLLTDEDESNSYTKYFVGEIWCSALWDMTWNLIQKYGINTNIFDATATGGNTIALNLVIAASKLTQCDPQLTEVRDALLRADTLLYSGSHGLEIWTAFAKRGLGVGANFGDRAKLKDGIGSYKIPTILPVAFGVFTAQKQDNTALLKWTTVQESNTDKFIVERSTDGKNFTSIGEVKAAGNSAVARSYQLIDYNPVKGNNIYHIKEMDKDGKFTLSELRTLNFADLRPSIKISPNPATNIVTINIPGNNQTLAIRLLSNAGQVIGNYVMPNESYTLDVSKLASGVYNILITGTGYSTKYKLVIQ